MSKFDLILDKPLMNAAGTLGFSPDLKSPVDVTRFGAFVTNPVSWLPRTPASGTRFIPFSGGFLLHTGHPNPGLKKVIRQHARRWAQSPVPVIVHLLAQDDVSLRRMVDRLEGVEGLMGVEIGLPPEFDVDQAYAMAVAAIGELSVIIKLPFESVGSMNASTLLDIGLSAVSLSPPRGTLTDEKGDLVTGRLCGPSIFPQTLAAVRKLVGLGIPIIGAGGVYTQSNVDAMLGTGATAVQLDAILWRGGGDLFR